MLFCLTKNDTYFVTRERLLSNYYFIQGNKNDKHGKLTYISMYILQLINIKYALPHREK